MSSVKSPNTKWQSNKYYAILSLKIEHGGSDDEKDESVGTSDSRRDKGEAKGDHRVLASTD